MELVVNDPNVLNFSPSNAFCLSLLFFNSLKIKQNNNDINIGSITFSRLLCWEKIMLSICVLVKVLMSENA